MPTPKISVIVPLFKTERYVEKCLRSIMRQTFTDFEIICVDDCTPDDSIAIVERLAKEDPRIVLIRHAQNLGLGGARNTGIRAAKAEYIASVDSDDYIDEGMLAALWEGTKDGYYDVVVCGFVRVDETGKVLSRHHKTAKIVDPIPSDQSRFNISNPAFWNKLWRKSLYVDNDIYFPLYIFFQDSATTPRIYTKARNVNFIGGLYYNYLVRGDSATNSTSDKHLLDRFRELDTVKDFFIKEGVYEDYKKNLNQRIFKGYRYHSENVFENKNGGEDATDRYLRHLLLMRDAYLMLDDAVRKMSTAEKIAALQEDKTILERVGGLPEESHRGDTVAAFPSPARRFSAGRPRVLVLTAYSGENEFEQCCASLASQSHDRWEHEIFSGLGKYEAQRSIYTTIMKMRDQYQLFVKLDADMVFSTKDTLAEIVDLFDQDENLDHFVVACDDYMTGQQVIGTHTFSDRVRWEPSKDGLFSDPNPLRPGRRVMMKAPPHSFFRHSFDPSPLQAFHFGAHRGLKLVQRGYTVAQKRAEAMNTQWQALTGVWRQFTALGDRRHALALIAADLVVTDQLGDKAYDYDDPTLIAAYEKYALYTSEKLRQVLQPNWGGQTSRERYFERAVGPEGLEKLALHKKERKAQEKKKNRKLSAA